MLTRKQERELVTKVGGRKVYLNGSGNLRVSGARPDTPTEFTRPERRWLSRQVATWNAGAIAHYQAEMKAQLGW